MLSADNTIRNITLGLPLVGNSNVLKPSPVFVTPINAVLPMLKRVAEPIPPPPMLAASK